MISSLLVVLKSKILFVVLFVFLRSAMHSAINFFESFSFMFDGASNEVKNLLKLFAISVLSVKSLFLNLIVLISLLLDLSDFIFSDA